MTNIFSRISVAAAVAIVFGLGAPSLEAQAPQPQPQEQVEVTDEVMETFAEAYFEIQVIAEEHQEALQTVQDQETAQELQQEANVRMAEVLRAHELTPERYTAIVAAINEDEELQDRLVLELERIRVERENGV